MVESLWKIHCFFQAFPLHLNFGDFLESLKQNLRISRPFGWPKKVHYASWWRSKWDKKKRQSLFFFRSFFVVRARNILEWWPSFCPLTPIVHMNWINVQGKITIFWCIRAAKLHDNLLFFSFWITGKMTLSFN